MTSSPLAKDEYVDTSTKGMKSVSPVPCPLPTDPNKATVSYWMSTTPPSTVPTSLPDPPSRTDIAIIGTGITGVSCAYHLLNTLSSDSASSILLLDAREFCSGATGRNGGHLTPVSALAYSDLALNPSHLIGGKMSNSPEQVKAHTTRAVGEILAFERGVAEDIRRLIKEQGAEEELGFQDGKSWHLCFNQGEVRAFEESLMQAKAAGLAEFVDQVRRVPKEEVDERMNSPRGVKEVFEIPGATLHPRKLVALIYRCAQRLAESKGIRLDLVTDTPVSKVTPSDSHFTLSTSHGDVSANYVVHATNGYASHLLPHLASPDIGIIPTRNQVIAVSPLSHTHLWGMGLSAEGGYDYGHQRPSPESPLYILGGGRQHAANREWGIADDSTLNPDVSAFLHPYLAKVFPKSYGEEVKMEWTGIIGYTKSKDPLVGPVEGRRGEWMAAGYSGHGMTRAWGCAEVVANMIGAEVGGEKWVKREGFPECYLTSEAKQRDAVEDDTQTSKKESTSDASEETKVGNREGSNDEKASTLSGQNKSCVGGCIVA